MEQFFLNLWNDSYELIKKCRKHLEQIWVTKWLWTKHKMVANIRTW